MIHSWHLREARRLYRAVVEGGDSEARKCTAQRFRKLEKASPRAASHLLSSLKSRENKYLLPEEVPETDDGF